VPAADSLSPKSERMMQPFKNFTGLVAPMDRSNVDTDQVIPKQFLKAVVRSGLGKGLFFDWRNQPDKGYVLDQPRFKGASILVARANFGCGSSREHAVWGAHRLRLQGGDREFFRRHFPQQFAKERIPADNPQARRG